MKKSVLFFGMIFFLISCNKDELDNNDEPTGDILAEANVGPGGALLSAEGIELEIPSGAFAASTRVQIIEEKEFTAEFDQNCVTSNYRVTGIPEDFAAPFILRCKYNGNLSNDSYIAAGIIRYLYDDDTDVTTYSLYEAYDSSGYLVAEMNPFHSQGNENTGLKSTNDDKGLSMVIMGITDFKKHKSEYFTIRHPFLMDKANIVVLAEHMDAAVDTFHSMSLLDKKVIKALSGIKYVPDVIVNHKSQYHKWSAYVPVRVVSSLNLSEAELKALWYSIEDVKFNINESFLLNAGNAEIASVAYAWVFRMLYYVYCGDALDWFGMASASYFKDKYSNHSYYQSYPLTNTIESTFGGIEPTGKLIQGDAVLYPNLGGFTNVQNLMHAAGMYPFIKYLDQTYSEDKTLFKRIISERANSPSKKSAEGIINALEDPEYNWWPGFLKHLMTGKLMDVPAETFLSLINSLDEVDYNTEDEKNNYLDAEYPDISAKLYKLNFNLPAFENDAKLELKIGPSSLNLDYVTAMVFGLKNDKFYYLGEGVEITVPNLKSLHEDGYKSLVVAVINSASEPPFDEKIKIELDVALKPAPLSFNRVKLEVKALTHYDFGIGSPIWYNYYQDQAIRGSMNNFTFVASWDGAPPDPNSTASHSKGRIEVQFDPERYPDVIIGYSINELLTYLSGTYEHTIIGTNIEISGNDSGLGLYSYTASLEDACKNISSLKYTYSDFNNEENSYSTDGSLNCADWGLLNFVFFYVEEDR